MNEMNTIAYAGGFPHRNTLCPCAADIAGWDEALFTGLCRVNRSLHAPVSMTDGARAFLSDLQACICSGDGLTSRTAFKAGGEKVVDRMLSILGLEETVSGRRDEEGCRVLSVASNPYGITSLYFLREPARIPGRIGK